MPIIAIADGNGGITLRYEADENYAINDMEWQLVGWTTSLEGEFFWRADSHGRPRLFKRKPQKRKCIFDGEKD